MKKWIAAAALLTIVASAPSAEAGSWLRFLRCQGIHNGAGYHATESYHRQDWAGEEIDSSADWSSETWTDVTPEPQYPPGNAYPGTNMPYRAVGPGYRGALPPAGRGFGHGFAPGYQQPVPRGQMQAPSPNRSILLPRSAAYPAPYPPAGYPHPAAGYRAYGQQSTGWYGPAPYMGQQRPVERYPSFR